VFQSVCCPQITGCARDATPDEGGIHRRPVGRGEQFRGAVIPTPLLVLRIHTLEELLEAGVGFQAVKAGIGI
jgi:hypothetical protein